MKKDTMIRLCKGNCNTPARFWNYIEVKESEKELYIKEGYVPDWRYKNNHH